MLVLTRPLVLDKQDQTRIDNDNEEKRKKEMEKGALIARLHPGNLCYLPKFCSSSSFAISFTFPSLQIDKHTVLSASFPLKITNYIFTNYNEIQFRN